VTARLLGLLEGHGPVLPLVAILATGLVVFALASRLARDASLVAGTTGLGGLWIGSVLLAASTSLPEVFTALSAASLDAPDVGVADLFGACLANMLILALLDATRPRQRILHQVATEHALLGLLGIVLAAIAATAILVGGFGRLGRVGGDTVVIGVTYLAGMRVVYRSLAIEPGPAEPAGAAARGRLGPALARIAAAAAGLAAVTPVLVVGAEALAAEAGLSLTFVGTLLVGMATSCPELAATVSAVRLGALDLAVGNVLGSVAFNLVLLLVLDLAYGRGPLLASIRTDHAVAALVAITCVALGVMAILSRTRRRPDPAAMESALILAAYGFGAWLLYRLGAG
jgi:cation:H+ antiporter